MNRKTEIQKKNLIGITLLVTVTLILALTFQNCGKVGFETLDTTSSGLDSMDHSGHVTSPPSGTPSVGRDPDYPTMGSVQYGVFGKIPRANGLVPEGQLGKAVIIRTDSKTYVSGMAIGLQPNQSYMAHVHVDTCANGAGGHYKKDETIVEAVESNEIWLTFNTDVDGYAPARAEVPYVAGPAKSLVIHNLDKSKYYCADFVSQETPTAVSKWFNGTFAPRPTTKKGTDIQGNVTKVVLANGMTGFRVSVWGLKPGQAYSSHVHQLSCAAGAGGHFLIDSAAAPAESNEAWFKLNASATGSATSEIWISQVTTTTETMAMSVIIHDPSDGTQQACADFTPRANHAAINGMFQLLDSSVDQKLLLASPGLLGIGGVGYKYSTAVDGAPLMQIYVSVSGLPTGNYVGHIHNRPCRKGAGGHYAIDMGLGKVEESNEVWVRVNVGTNGLGSISATLPIALRADAMSLVIHHPDNSKLICADLL